LEETDEAVISPVDGSDPVTDTVDGVVGISRDVDLAFGEDLSSGDGSDGGCGVAAAANLDDVGDTNEDVEDTGSENVSSSASCGVTENGSLDNVDETVGGTDATGEEDVSSGTGVVTESVDDETIGEVSSSSES